MKVPQYPLMKCSEIAILKDLQNFKVECKNSDDINDFFARFVEAVNSSDEGRTINQNVDGIST